MWQGKRVRFSWDKRSYVELFVTETGPPMVSRLAVIRSHILHQVEWRGLCFPSKLDRYREQGMPWLEKCLVGLPNKMVHGEKLETLTFLSCIGIIENGDYVDYVAPRELTLDLPLRQSKMQELHLQSHHSLPKVGPLVVWRLHEDIPCRVPKLETHLTSKEPQNKKPRQEEPEDIQAVDEEDRPADIQKQTPGYIPINCHPRWSAAELSFVDLTRIVSHRKADIAYLKQCEQNLVPARHFKAFIKKRQRMQRDN